MHRDIASCENDRPYLEEGIVKLTFGEASLVPIYLYQCGGLLYRDMIRRNTDEVTIFAMLLLDRLGALCATTLSGKPEGGNLCCDRARECSERRQEELIDDVRYCLRMSPR